MSQSFWNASASLISSMETHPFLVSMLDGTLEIESFQYYALQDALQLADFAHALGLMADKMAGVDSNVSKLLHEFKSKAEEAHESLQKSFFPKWNIHDSASTQMPITLLYTSYMLRIVSTKCAEEGLAVLLPSFWVYMHIGNCMLKLRTDLGESVKRAPQYNDWIDMYGCEEYEQDVKDYIAIVDDAAQKSDDEILKRMEEHFIMSCKLLHMFWDQAQTLMKWPDIK